MNNLEQDIKRIKNDIKKVSGIYFKLSEVPILLDNQENIFYVIYPKKAEFSNLSALGRFIRMFAISYRMVLIENDGDEFIGFVLIGNPNEREELDSTMSWVALSHPEWMVCNLQDKSEYPSIIGYRIANNLFHAKKLLLLGEVLE